MIQIHVTGVEEAIAAFDPASFAPGLRRGMQRAGDLIAVGAKQLVRPHHWRGRFEREIHTEVTGSGLDIHARVGVSAFMVPEARPISYGWKSEAGKRPPTQAIAEWVATKPEIANSASVYRNAEGFVRRTGTIASVSQEQKIRGIAFVIARAIGKRGYSFPPVRPFERALAAVRGQIGAVIAEELGRGR